MAMGLVLLLMTKLNTDVYVCGGRGGKQREGGRGGGKERGKEEGRILEEFLYPDPQFIPLVFLQEILSGDPNCIYFV